MKNINSTTLALARYFFALTLFALLTACGGGSGGSSDPSSSAGLEVSPSSLRLIAAQNGPLPLEQSFVVKVTSDEIAKVVGVAPPGASIPAWITFKTGQSSSGIAVLVGANTTNLAPGDYTVTIRMAGLRADRSVVAYRDVSLVYHISTLSTGINSFDVAYVIGTPDPLPRQVMLSASGHDWTAASNQTWLTVNQSSGSGGAALLVYAHPVGKAAGIYSGQISIKSTNGDEAIINVRLLVSDLSLQTSATTLNFSAENGTAVSPQPVSLSLNSGQAFNWTATTSAPWLEINRNSGTQADAITVTVNPTKGPLASGNYSAQIEFSSVVGTQNLIKSIIVNLVLAKPTLPLYSSSMNFSGVNGTAIPAQTLNLSLSGAQTFNWTASSDSGWLVLNRTSGTQGDALSIAVNPTIGSLASGNYTGQIQISATVNGDVITNPVRVNLALTKPSLILPPGLGFAGFNGDSFAAQNFKVMFSSGQAINWTATVSAPWIVLNRTSGVQGDSIDVVANPANGNLASGYYNGQITVTTKINGDIISAAVPVGLSLSAHSMVMYLPPYYDSFLTYQQYPLDFVGVNGAPIAAQKVKIAVNGLKTYGWTATSKAAWLQVNRPSGSEADFLEISVNPAVGSLPSGTYDGNIEVNSKVNGDTLSFVVSARMRLSKPSFTLSKTAISLGGTNGRDLSGRGFNLSLDTGSNAYPWTLAQDGNWITASATSGTVSAISIPIGVAPDYFKKVESQASNDVTNLTFSAKVNGDVVTATLPVTLLLDTHKLIVSEQGVAFAKTPAWSRLSRTLKTIDNLGIASSWKASSSKPWLSVTASGVAGGDLVLTADPASLALDTLHEATVTLTSDDTSVKATEKVQVGMWVGSTTPAATVRIPELFAQVKVDPVRPYAYVNNGGTELRTYNIYTGLEVLPRIVNVAPTLGAMAISNDASTLYVMDTTNNKIIPIDLASRSAKTGWPVATQYSSNQAPGYILYTRTNGEGIVMANAGISYLAKTGAPLGSGTSTIDDVFTVSGDGSKLFSRSTLYDLDYTSINSGIFSMGWKGNIGIYVSNVMDAAANWDGSRAYFADSGALNFPRANGLTLASQGTLPASYYPNNIELGSDGRVFGAASNDDLIDIWVYDEQGYLQKSFKAGGYNTPILARQMAVSGDAFMLVVATSKPELQFIPVGP
jgi:hypothetical protein